MMIKQFAKRNKVSRVHERAKASTYSMNVQPFIVLIIENTLVGYYFVRLLQLLEQIPLSFKVFKL